MTLDGLHEVIGHARQCAMGAGMGRVPEGEVVDDGLGGERQLPEDEELAQAVKMILQTRKGEFFLELEHGLVYDNILGKEANQDEARDDIIEAVSQEERIVSVKEVPFVDDWKDRTRLVSLKLQKDNGETLSIEGVDLSAG